jgi:hypothetical protein
MQRENFKKPFYAKRAKNPNCPFCTQLLKCRLEGKKEEEKEDAQ